MALDGSGSPLPIIRYAYLAGSRTVGHLFIRNDRGEGGEDSEHTWRRACDWLEVAPEELLGMPGTGVVKMCQKCEEKPHEEARKWLER